MSPIIDRMSQFSNKSYSTERTAPIKNNNYLSHSRQASATTLNDKNVSFNLN